MQLRLVRRGGIAGIPVVTTVDDDEIRSWSSDVVKALRELPFGQDPGPGAPDRFRYELTFTDEAGPRTAVVHEDQVAPALAPLIAELSAKARPVRKQTNETE